MVLKLILGNIVPRSRACECKCLVIWFDTGSVNSVSVKGEANMNGQNQYKLTHTATYDWDENTVVGHSV